MHFSFQKLRVRFAPIHLSIFACYEKAWNIDLNKKGKMGGGGGGVEVVVFF